MSATLYEVSSGSVAGHAHKVLLVHRLSPVPVLIQGHVQAGREAGNHRVPSIAHIFGRHIVESSYSCCLGLHGVILKRLNPRPVHVMFNRLLVGLGCWWSCLGCPFQSIIDKGVEKRCLVLSRSHVVSEEKKMT